MNDIDIRVAMMDCDTRKRIKELSISKGDEDIFTCISIGYVTSGAIAKYLKVNVNTISTRLKSLKDRGYLAREETASITGGLEYRYKNIYSINK